MKKRKRTRSVIGTGLGTLLRVLSVVLVLTMGTGLLYLSQLPPPTEPAALRPPISVPTAFAAPTTPPPLALRVAREIVDELTRKSHLAVNPRGELVPAGDGAVKEGWRQLFHPDPVHWGSILKQLTSLRQFHDWLRQGGEPEGLSPEVVEALRRSNEICSRLGLPAPFHPFLDAQPAGEPVPLHPRLRRYLLASFDLPETVDGWFGTAAAAWARLYRLNRQMGDLAERHSAGKSVGLDLPRGLMGYDLGIPVSFTDFVGGLYTVPENRTRVTAWLRPLATEQRTLAYALARAIQAMPEDEDRLAVMGDIMLDRAPAAWFHHLAFAKPEYWTGMEPRTPAQWLLHARIAQESVRVRLLAEQDHAELTWTARSSWEKAMELRPNAGEHAGSRVAIAFAALAKRLEGPARAQELYELYHEHRDILAGIDSPALAGPIQTMGETWIDVRLDPAPDEEDLLAVVEWIDGHPEAWRKAEDARRASELSETLLQSLENF